MKQSLSQDASSFFDGAVAVVTGGVGSVGAEVVRQLLTLGVREVRALDNNESALFEAEQEYADEPRFKAFHADIVNEWETLRVFSGADYVFHAAALKHVPSCERSPFSAIDSNVVGIQSVIRAAQRNGIKKVLFTSSDKAVNPTNVMGATKLLGERLFSAANFMSVGPSRDTVFSSTRFGNVAGSRGSVIPLFLNQIRQGKAVTLTDERMTRFIMSQHEAAALVIESIVHAQGGETFITKMPVLRIADLARVMIQTFAPLYGHNPSDIKITVTGSRPGEKLWEELSSDEESRRILEGEKYLCVVSPTHGRIDTAEERYKALDLKRSSCIYNSEYEDKMDDEEILDFLLEDGVLPVEVREMVVRAKMEAKSLSSSITGKAATA